MEEMITSRIELDQRREIERLTAEVRDAFSQGFWVGFDAPAALPKNYVDEAFDRRNEGPISGSQPTSIEKHLLDNAVELDPEAKKAIYKDRHELFDSTDESDQT